MHCALGRAEWPLTESTAEASHVLERACCRMRQVSNHIWRSWVVGEPERDLCSEASRQAVERAGAGERGRAGTGAGHYRYRPSNRSSAPPPKSDEHGPATPYPGPVHPAFPFIYPSLPLTALCRPTFLLSPPHSPTTCPTTPHSSSERSRMLPTKRGLSLKVRPAFSSFSCPSSQRSSSM